MTEDNAKHNRFKDAPWYPKYPTLVLVGGSGGIGTWFTLLLSRAGFQAAIFDFDTVEEHNMGGQLFGVKHIGEPKVVALQEIVKEFSGENLMISEKKINASSPTNNYVVSAFDNMLARKDLFENWYATYGSDPKAIFIDGRLSAEHMQIFCVTPDRAEAYREHLFDDAEVEEAPCTMKQTSHAAAMIAAHMVGFFTNHISNVHERADSRTVPFYWEYFIPMDLLDVQFEPNAKLSEVTS